MSIRPNPILTACKIPTIIIFLGLIILLFFCAGNAIEEDVKSIKLSPDEKSWLGTHSKIKLAPEINYPPFIFSDKSGTITGLSADYITLLEKKLGVEFTVLPPRSLSSILKLAKKGEVDVITSLKKTPEREAFLNFTKPYIHVPTVIIARKNDNRKFSLSETSSIKLAVGESYGVQAFLSSNYPHLNIIGLPDDLVGLRKLSFGEVDAVVMDIASASYFIEREGIVNLRIAAKTDYSYDLALAVRKDWPELIQILDKGLAGITGIERKEIHRKWIKLDVPSIIRKEVLYFLLLLLGSLTLFVCLAWYSNRKLKKEIDERKRVEEELKSVQDGLELQVTERTTELQNEINGRKQVSEQLHNIEWLLKKTVRPRSGQTEYAPPYGDLITLNTKRLILDSVGEEVLKDIVGDFLDLLDTSSAIYETNGDYALGLFSSGWCRFLDNASRNLCPGDSNQEALESGLWLCHESCWTDASKGAIETGQPTDIECKGGIRLYAIPIMSGQKIIGAINFGYGTPPTDRQKLQEIAEIYNAPFEQLLEKAEAYEERPKYILEIAKKRLHTAARLIGEIAERKLAEEKLQQSQAELEKRVEARTAELRKSKEEWEKTFNAMSEIVTIQDNNMRILKANKATYKLFQAGQEDIIGKYCYEVFRGGNQPCPQCPVLDTLGDLRHHSNIITHDNLGKIFNVTTTPLYEENGEFHGIVHTAKDITEHKKMEEELFQAHKMEAIGTLAGGIAHDFNNILAAIIGYADIVKEDLTKRNLSSDYINEVLRAGNRAKELVKQILTFSRKSQETRRSMEPYFVIKEALKLMRASLPTTIEIQERIDSESGSILANPTNIHQVLVNLCTNALHAMEDEQGVITVTLKKVELDETEVVGETGVAAGTFVELMVSDTGHGMSNETVERIFEPYFTTKEIDKGTGMGLAVVHGIIKSCKGFIKVDSAPGKGSTFRVYFPAIIEEKTFKDRKEQQPSLPKGNERILVVDDEETVTRMYTAILEELGYKVTGLYSSEKTLETFQSSPDNYDLIITDQTMPHIPGSELAKKILQIRPDIPIILCTGYSSMISEEKSKAIGINRFLMKPVNLKDLAFTVRELLDEHKLS